MISKIVELDEKRRSSTLDSRRDIYLPVIMKAALSLLKSVKSYDDTIFKCASLHIAIGYSILAIRFRPLIIITSTYTEVSNTRAVRSRFYEFVFVFACRYVCVCMCVRVIREERERERESVL